MIGDLHRAGAEPAVVLRDLLELSHTLTRAKLVPEMLDDPETPETERVRGRALADKLSLPALARTWQMLLKGLGESPGGVCGSNPTASGSLTALLSARPTSTPSRKPTATQRSGSNGASGATSQL